MRKLYIMRHGQTLFNLRKKTQGWSDSPLTELGIKQAQKAKAYFEKYQILFDGVYTSTSERSIDTKEIITDLPHIALKGLKEWNFGMLEGESEDLQKVPRKPGQLTHEDFFVPFGGESAEMLLERIDNTIQNILHANHKNTLIAGHAGAMWVYFLKRNHPSDLKGAQFGNCSILEYNVLYKNVVEFVQLINPLAL
mgnify:CR=1 FL=1